MNHTSVPVIGFVAYSGTGKTTLLKKLILELKQRNIRVGAIKHAHHNFDIDTPGKDSYELRKAGADQMLVASAYRWALMVETPAQKEADLNELLQQLDTTKLDLILVEGFKHESYAKIECHRPSLGHDLLFPHDKSIIALASDEKLEQVPPIALLDLNNVKMIADFIQTEILDQTTG